MDAVKRERMLLEIAIWEAVFIVGLLVLVWHLWPVR